MRIAMLRLSKLNVFVEPDGRDGCKFVLRVIKGQRERERGRGKKKWEDKIEAKKQEERSATSR